MKAYVSYSLGNSDRYVLSILASRLKEKGFVVSTAYDSYNNIAGYNSYSQIIVSNLFIGIIVNNADIRRVLSEWKIALDNHIPALLLIDDKISVPENLRHHPNVVSFNRENPNIAIEIVKDRIDASRQSPAQLENSSNVAAWIFGGLATLVLIKLLTSDD